MIATLVALLLAAPAAAPMPVSQKPISPKPISEAWDRTPASVSGAWVRANPVPGRPAAGYLTITGGGAPDKLVGVTAPGLRIEMHSMSMAGGVMKMAKLESVAVPAGAKVAFASGGHHLMIFGLSGTPKAVPLTLVFGSGAKLTTSADVRAPGAAAADPQANPHAGH